ncbi:unnamed protein product [Trifolium pratense]|uniref:Uncharacterized protein n=1 Tax=Trifolium pratense TaxID=57577 RepID=A0ACB0KPG4_TRIPR|nr:unnamed protein product [Trifolium pratense]
MMHWKRRKTMKGIGWMLRFMMASLEKAKFVFWDNTLDELFGMTTAIIEKMEKCGLGEPQVYPEAMDDLMERKYTCCIFWIGEWCVGETFLEPSRLFFSFTMWLGLRYSCLKLIWDCFLSHSQVIVLKEVLFYNLKSNQYVFFFDLLCMYVSVKSLRRRSFNKQ